MMNFVLAALAAATMMVPANVSTCNIAEMAKDATTVTSCTEAYEDFDTQFGDNWELTEVVYDDELETYIATITIDMTDSFPGWYKVEKYVKYDLGPWCDYARFGNKYCVMDTSIMKIK